MLLRPLILDNEGVNSISKACKLTLELFSKGVSTASYTCGNLPALIKPIVSLYIRGFGEGKEKVLGGNHTFFFFEKFLLHK